MKGVKGVKGGKKWGWEKGKGEGVGWAWGDHQILKARA